ncbi:unnamed protein product, partial [Ilex paraguariensis]
VAYVLGQLQNKTTSNALFGILRDVNEHPMVRYEAVQALLVMSSIVGTTLQSSGGVHKQPITQ